MRRKKDLRDQYPDSPPCSCAVCVSFCRRPGWWTVEEALAALEAGYGPRMMLEMGPRNAFGVLSPAFKGAEQGFATAQQSANGCTFLADGRCELHDTVHEPLECRFCHHDRPGQGTRCHSDIERQWNSAAGRKLVVKWSNQTEFWSRRMPPQGAGPAGGVDLS